MYSTKKNTEKRTKELHTSVTEDTRLTFILGLVCLFNEYFCHFNTISVFILSVFQQALLRNILYIKADVYQWHISMNVSVHPVYSWLLFLFCLLVFFKQALDYTEWERKYGQSIDTVTLGYTRRRNRNPTE